jgi:hypothetical protein
MAASAKPSQPSAGQPAKRKLAAETLAEDSAEGAGFWMVQVACCALAEKTRTECIGFGRDRGTWAGPVPDQAAAAAPGLRWRP